MSTIDTGGPAFPMQDPQAIHAYAVASVSSITDPDERDRAYLKARADAVGGASLRDYFAAKAMQAICSQPDAPDWTAEGIAIAAYQQADALLKVRSDDNGR